MSGSHLIGAQPRELPVAVHATSLENLELCPVLGATGVASRRKTGASASNHLSEECAYAGCTVRIAEGAPQGAANRAKAERVAERWFDLSTRYEADPAHPTR